jgi:hypothetical protein
MLSRCRCPGTISLLDTAMPIRGRLNSSSIKPRALNKDLWGERAMPLFTESLLISFSSQFGFLTTKAQKGRKQED